jgi:ActR/RegA family two-component response regulator
MTTVGGKRDAKRALVVEPDPAFASDLAGRLRPYADVTTCSTFPRARAQLSSLKPQFLVTALALREYNGLHLVYLASADDLQTRSIVYCNKLDVGLAAEVQAAGAFFELQHRLAAALPVYAAAMALPASDRRTVTRPDRRISPRGGRRATDLQIAGSV